MHVTCIQKLTSPKWNRFKGIRLRWKDKIRLNNVIWRCWHMQFILKQNTLVCQFASPLDVDTHNKPEAVVLEGKYWKRKLAAVTAEYKKWRMFYRNRILGWTNKDGTDMLESMDMLDWDTGMMGSSMGFGSGLMNVNGNSSGLQGSDSVHNMMVDEDYMELMTDTLFSTISSNQPLYFPDPREIARGASLADFIQPSLGPLQPNLDDFMDTLEPLQEFLNSKLPPVPEEEDIFRTGSLNTNYSDLYLVGTMNHQVNHLSSVTNQQQQHHQQRQDNSNDLQNIQYNTPSPNIIYRNTTTNNNDNYLDNRDKLTRAGRSLIKGGNRVIQHSQQQQQQHPNFVNNISHQVVAYQSPQQILQNQQIQQENQRLQSTNNYNNLDIQQVLSSPSQNSSRQIESHIHNNISQSQNYSSSTQPNTTNQQQIIELTNPFKILTTQQNYKLPQNSSYTTGQFKYHGKNSANQQTSSNITNQSTALIAAAAPASTTSSSSTNQNNVILHNNKPALNHQKLQQRTITTTPSILPTTLTPSTITTNNNNQDKEEIFAVPKYQMKARSRSRSSSALNQTRNHPPPLVSAISDPSLNINNNVLLAQLLTNNTSGLYTVSNGPDKLMLTQQQNNTNIITSSGLKKIQPILPSINKNIQLTNPIVIQQQINNSTNLARVSSNSSSSTSSNSSNSSSSSSSSSSSCGNSTSNNNNSSITNHSDSGNNNNNNCNSINNNNNNNDHCSSSSSSSSSRSSSRSSSSNKNSVNKTIDTSEKSSMTIKKNYQGQNNNKNVSNDTTTATTTTGSTNVHSPQGLNTSPLNSPMNIDNPLSPNSNLFIKNDNNERGQYKEQRRVGHIHAEQKRRYNIKNGFDMLHNLIPQLNQNPNAKLSKAAMLQKGADYIRQLRNERNQIKEEMDNLKQQIDNLNLSITNCQSLLPATGAPVLRQRTNKMKEMFDDYVKKRTRENWKFWIFSILLEPLMISFNASVSTASVEDLCRSTILWVEQHCSLVDLRPAVLNSLRYLCTATEILSDPARLPEEALAAVNQPEKR
ncbi:GATA zinc finger domain-containing protein 14-like isoform X2 [Aphidius gifuensis]|uniref:GATA zinc finger domain-containing protein 14-like isoform X2 n=1 Tax=Aphidius gifuensis TaxID=684658 RepID=UPI001CDCDDF9|nr:GATA zinc finger domain-containing protein 14-like isoform X2 [Aphidius gifuensis]